VLDYAGQQASGVRYWVRDTEHVEKAFVFGGMPARNGTTAAALVAGGFTGVADLFTGEANFLDTFSTRPRPERLVDGLGRRFEIMATNIKKYPVGSPIQAPLEAVTTLIERHRIRSGDVAAVAVRMPSKRTVDNRDMPDVNLQYILAVTLVDGRLTFDAAHSYERMRDRAVQDVKQLITVDEDPGLRTAESSRTAVVEITLRGGGTFREHVKAVPGTAQRPMKREEVAAKCQALFAPVLGASRTDQLIEAVRALERLADVRQLRTFLSATPA
jgi:2-methylcitrate dehydratase PrpD